MVTIKDIASQAGVSVSTVSRVINNRRDVSSAVRQKVMQVADDLNYIPNESARDLAGSKTDSIGVIMRGIDNTFFSEMLATIGQSISRTKYSFISKQIPETADEIQAAAELARAKRLSGLIIMGGSFSYSQNQIDLLQVPFVFCSYSNKFGSLSNDHFSSISLDDEAEAYKAVSTLIDYGHERIAILLVDTADQSISELRYRGYCRALKDHGLDLDPSLVQLTPGFDLADAYRATLDLVGRTKDFTALFAISDMLAVAAMKAFDSAGLKIPQDVSVLGIDGLNITEYTIPTLTSLVQPKQEMAEQSVELLLDLMEKKGKNRQLVLETSLRLGGSVRRLS